jgi:hypothetical protein
MVEKLGSETLETLHATEREKDTISATHWERYETWIFLSSIFIFSKLPMNLKKVLNPCHFERSDKSCKCYYINIIKIFP